MVMASLSMNCASGGFFTINLRISLQVLYPNFVMILQLSQCCNHYLVNLLTMPQLMWCKWARFWRMLSLIKEFFIPLFVATITHQFLPLYKRLEYGKQHISMKGC